MEECDSLDSEVTEFQCEASEAASQDDDDELEELQNSLREAVQDPSVKPKFQCLMVDPSFSMVTVQSEDSGIVWETASSRCSTPWASETSSISEAYSMEGSGAAGKITIVFEEEKVARRRVRSGGRSSRLADRLSRPGGSRTASALGAERAEMTEVSVPNVTEEKAAAEADLEGIRTKDQQLFSLISEGYEILNIRVPTKLPTVDEEESTELQDNLSYLDQTPKIKSRNQEWTQQGSLVLQDEETPAHGEPTESSQPAVESELRPQRDGASDIDYFEKFTLVDAVGPGERAREEQEMGRPAAKGTSERSEPVQETPKDGLPESEDSFVIVSDADIVGEHLDEVFYGGGAPAERGYEAECGAGTRSRRESQRSAKESGSVLFETEETTLTPIFISPGPPKIIDPILLEEPAAMSFMYSDLYEDAVGERRKSDEEHSESESVASEKTSRRRLSDAEEADGYLEKFILKDETPTVELPPESAEDRREGRMMWAQSKFEMTGCLSRVAKGEDEVERGTEEPDMAAQGGDDPKRAKFDEHAGQTAEKQSSGEGSIQESMVRDEEVKWEVSKDQSESPESSGSQERPPARPVSSKDEETEPAESFHTDQSCQSQREEKIMEKGAATVTDESVGVTAEVVAAGGQDTPTGSETETSQWEAKGAVASSSVEATAEWDAAASGEGTDKRLEEKELHMELQEPGRAEKTDHPSAGGICEAESPETGFLIEVEQETEGDDESGATRPAEGAGNSSEGKLSSSEGKLSSSEGKLSSSEGKLSSSERKLHDSRPHPEEKLGTTGALVGKTPLIPEAKEEESTQDNENSVDETAAEDFVLLVPKGQAVEMDIELSHFPKTRTDDSQWGDLTPPLVTMETESPHPPDDGTLAEPQLEVKGRADEEEKSHLCPPAPAEDAITHQEEVGKHEGVVSSLRSFIPQEESSGLEEDMSSEAKHEGEEVEISKAEDWSPEADVCAEDEEQKLRPEEEEEEEEEAAESPDVNAEELDYEVICEQEAEELRGAEEPEPEPEPQQELTHLSPEEEQIEDDYEVFDAEEERQARLAAELQGLDWFCFTCGDLLSKDERASEEHRNHEVADVDAAYEQIKERLSGWISELQEGSENLEDLVSDLEVAYNSVEEQCVEAEAAMRAQNEEMMALVMDQYNDMSVGMEEEKKAKLEQIYDQIVSVQDSIDSARTTLETTAREAETEARTPEDINTRLKAAWESAASLELGPQVLMVFEDYAKGHTSSSHVERCKGIPVPQRPRLQPQEPGSATSTSVTVYWRVGPGDVIDCFQVYCMEEPRGVVSEEYRVTVKESSCVLEELEPDKTYKVWVMAVNYTGCSLPSDQLAFRTAPSVPVIDAEQCTVLWDSATLRWRPSHQVPQQRFTLEYCRQYEPEGEGLRSISGIEGCERKVPLQPNENYLFYIKAANEAGTSEQSEAALVSTRGTKFQLLGHTAHPALELSADRTTLHYCHQAPEGSAPTDAECPSILGELLLPPGRYYWETVVTRSTAYRLGVVTGAASRRSPLGENSLSWCLQCVPAVSGCRYHLLHINIQSSLFVTETPERVGTLLDYQLGRLSFYNAHSGQLLGAFCQRFAQPCHPALALEMPGSLEVSMVLEMPDFLKNS